MAKDKEAYNYLNEKFKVEPLTIENWSSNISYQEINNFLMLLVVEKSKKRARQMCVLSEDVINSPNAVVVVNQIQIILEDTMNNLRG